MMGSPWPHRNEELRATWHALNGRPAEVARAMGLRKGQIDGQAMRLNLQFKARGRGKTITRGSAPDVEARTIFPDRVRAPAVEMLKSGRDNRKLGRVITKGPWKGFPIYSLTLEERRTCPRSCQQWLSCYGSNMRWAARYAYSGEFEIALWKNLHRLQQRHAGGFAVRLHSLGDFACEGYVDFWQAALDHFPALHCWGYTAHQSDTPIGKKVWLLRIRHWDRFAIRTSGADAGPRTLVVSSEAEAPDDAIVCPVERGRAQGCFSCGLCWSLTVAKRPIAFVRH